MGVDNKSSSTSSKNKENRIGYFKIDLLTDSAQQHIKKGSEEII
jgi:hypothetical protein